MFEFYRIIAVPGTDEKEIEKLQYEETPENLALKERLEKEIAEYEQVEIIIIDRYYHCDRYEKTYPLSLSYSVFEGETFVGYMVGGVCYTTPENEVRLREEVRGATSFWEVGGIRRKR